MYANKATKEIVTKLAGCAGFAEVLDEANHPMLKKVKRNVKGIAYNAYKVMDHLMDGLDLEHARAVRKTANSCVLQVMPKYSPKADEEWQWVKKDAMERLIADALSECTFCDKSKKEIKKCQKRKDLLDCQIYGNGKDCPMMGIMPSK